MARQRPLQRLSSPPRRDPGATPAPETVDEPIAMRCASSMTTRRSSAMRSFAFASLCVLAACGKSDSGKKDDIAKAFSGPASKQDGDPAKRMADLKAKAEADATKAR